MNLVANLTILLSYNILQDLPIFFTQLCKIAQKLELCSKDTDAPIDNIYMVYSEKINKGP
jgi:hypothetical protein